MYLVALLERVPGGWRAWIPALPGCEATGATEADAEAALRPLARERVTALKTPGERAHVARLKAIDIAIRVRRPDLIPPLPPLDVETREMLLSHIDALVNSRRLPRTLLNEICSFRRELVFLHPELDEEEVVEFDSSEGGMFGMLFAVEDVAPENDPFGEPEAVRITTKDAGTGKKVLRAVIPTKLPEN